MQHAHMNQHQLQRHSTTRRQIASVRHLWMRVGLHGAREQPKLRCCRLCGPFFRLATTSARQNTCTQREWERQRQRERACEVSHVKSSPAGACYTTTRRITNSIFHTHSTDTHTRMAGLMPPDVRHLNLKPQSARRPFELPQKGRVRERQRDFGAPLLLSATNLYQIICCVGN